ncbi:hypothetical protein JQC92_14590 [Shewanella sp. 202IG2-18]|uniref:hypothetical protein n=1 Tax=Parashewanella hymeniacidonis TaxID=2807618 RepID=UPI001961192A|nr:hypothetical protein [Parashewanella hymeniacidonis]MBM7073241.1 hypothetical protein [Parashewanella hymeniacidonis]
MPLSLRILSIFYVLIVIAAVWRFVDANSLEMFTVGVLPVLYGVWRVESWTLIVLRVYLACQTLGVVALGATAVIAYQITPEDVKVVFEGHTIPMLPLVVAIIGFLSFQWWVAFSVKNIKYFKQQ